jgi:cytosine/adenosine deaminase-related metal-dependent hydrolase
VPAREQWQQVYEGKSPLLLNVNNAATILHVLKLLEPYPEVRILLLATGGNVYQTLDQLQGRKVSLILRPSIDLVPNSRDRVCVSCLAHKAGLDFAISLSLDEFSLSASQDAPLFPVAHLVRVGLPRQVALESLSIRPARMLGIDKTHGSIEPGKTANLLVFDGDPLDPSSQLREVLIEGATVYEN